MNDVILGRRVHIGVFVNLYGCVIGDESLIGPFVEIQRGVVIGRRCKIESHTFICEGVKIEDDVFIGHGVMFINDRYPRISIGSWNCEATLVKKGASIGSGATVLCGVTIGEDALVGAGSVVTHNVSAKSVVSGNPARFMRNC